MNQQTLQSLKLWASCASFLFFAACGFSNTSGSSKAGVSGSSCVQVQNVQASLHQALNQVALNSKAQQLLVRMKNLHRDYDHFQDELVKEFGSEVLVTQISDETVAVDLPAGARTSKTIQQHIDDNKIDYLEPDHRTFRVDTGGAPETLNQAQAQTEVLPKDLRARAQAGKQVIVAVIDSGVDTAHKDLAPYLWKNPKEIAGNKVDDDRNGFVDDIHGWDFVNEDGDPTADDEPIYHGTHVAGIVKQAALLAEQGINVKIMALKYLDASAAGRTSNAIRAIDYAIQNGAKVLSNSWGAPTFSSALSDAIERARQAQVLFLAAAGNGDVNGDGVDNDKLPFYPSSYPHNNIISVAATDWSGYLAPWSNFGLTSVDVAGPGVGIQSTTNGNKYAVLSGTSMATPYVAGVAGLLWSVRPDLSYSEIRRVLLESVIETASLEGKVVTGGMISRAQAVKKVSTYAHDPNYQPEPGMNPITICEP